MAANALPGLQARRRVALLLEEVHADSSTTTQTRKALALLNAKPSVDTYMWKAGWRLRSVFRAVKGRPAEEDDGTGAEAVAEAEAGTDGADPEDGLELAGVAEVPYENQHAGPVELLAGALASHATAAQLDKLWDALELAVEVSKSGTMVLGGPRREHVFGLTSLREEVGRLHGVLQEVGRLTHRVLDLEPRALRRVCLLRSGHPQNCRFGTDDICLGPHTSRSKGDGDSSDRRQNGARDSNSESERGRREGGASSAAGRSGWPARAAEAADSEARLDAYPTASGSGEKQQPQKNAAEGASGSSSGSCGGGEDGGGGDSRGGVTDRDGAAGKHTGQVGGDDDVVLSDDGNAAAGGEASEAQAEAEATEAERRAWEEREAVVKATAGWCLGSIVMLLHQGVDFRGVMYRLSGSKLLGGLQDIARTLQYQLRKTAQLQVGAPGDGGAGAGGGERTQSAVLFAHTVHLQLVLLRELASQHVSLQLFEVLNSYCRDGWLSTTAKAAVATAAAAGPAPAAPAAPAAPPSPWAQSSPRELLLELYARSTLEIELLSSRLVMRQAKFQNLGAQAVPDIEQAVEQAAKQQKATTKELDRQFSRLGRMPLLHQLARAALTAELDVMRGRVSAARDAYRKAAKQAEVAAAVAAARAGAGAGVSGPAAEAAEAAEQQRLQARQPLVVAEAEQHVHEVLMKLCDWQDKVRQQSCERQRLRQQRRAATKAAVTAAALAMEAARLDEQDGGTASVGAGQDGKGLSERAQLLDRMIPRHTRGAGGVVEQQANGAGGSGSGGSDGDESDDSDEERAECWMNAERDPLRLRVEPGSFTATEAASGGAPVHATGLLSADGSVSTFTRMAALSADHVQGPRWWSDQWQNLVLAWPCGVVPCTFGSMALYGADEKGGEGGRLPAEGAPAGAGPAAAATGGAGEAAGEGGGGGGGCGAAGVQPARRRQDAAKLMMTSIHNLVYGVEEGLPFVALGSYTLALLLRHLLQLQSSRATPQVLQPTAIRAPGRHTREDPHSLPEGSEPCVVLAQLGYVPDFGIDKRPRPVREYVHAASPATAGSSSFAAAKASSGGKGDGVGRQQQQEQRQQLTNDLRTFISESLDEDGYVKLLCMSCEEVAGAVLAISQVRQARRAEAEALAAVAHRAAPKGLASSGVAAARLDQLRKEIGFAVVIPSETKVITRSPLLSLKVKPDDPNFDTTMAGELMLMVMLLSEVDVKARRVKASVMDQLELERELGGSVAVGTGRGLAAAGASGAHGSGRVGRVVGRRA
ncbi:hypothetical protein CHLRE_03g205701v5 [Chlamydomonas reinhardtii]|uniref:Uncharacterized protein n=1 Tax=Chlamydomonas reinhardtii TaxID=3055 RepID=A0A2K3DZ17_CHLRE|nr:uncharacterized protein CHLRE_03g205701v5 [Chlamydomonas reinhardtii]PNW85780.1 hypothetical protein CHLRE_03g205701v5 [Chlamydomonas reinhardtii]